MTVPLIGEIRAGFYQVRLIKGGIMVGCRFWHGAPVFDGEELDRSHRWCVAVDGATTRPALDADGLPIEGVRELLDAWEVWPYACGRPISEREFQFLARRRTWAVEHDPQHPAAQPRKPVDVLQLKPGW